MLYLPSYRKMESPRLIDGRINLDAPRYDQSTFLGRAKHFFTITDPRNILRTAKELDEAKDILIKYRYNKKQTGIRTKLQHFECDFYGGFHFGLYLIKIYAESIFMQSQDECNTYLSLFQLEQNPFSFTCGHKRKPCSFSFTLCYCLETFFNFDLEHYGNVSVIKV